MAHYCSNCGNEIEETDRFCSRCGKSIAEEIEEEIEKTEKTESKQIPSNIIKFTVLAVLLVGTIAYLNGFETRYETVYSGTLSDTGLTTRTWSFEKADYYTQEFTGNDLWGQGEYKFRVCWTGVTCKDYFEINAWDINKGYKAVTKARIDWMLGR